jgi:hypothetical protein
LNKRRSPTTNATDFFLPCPRTTHSQLATARRIAV